MKIQEAAGYFNFSVVKIITKKKHEWRNPRYPWIKKLFPTLG